MGTIDFVNLGSAPRAAKSRRRSVPASMYMEDALNRRDDVDDDDSDASDADDEDDPTATSESESDATETAGAERPSGTINFSDFPTIRPTNPTDASRFPSRATSTAPVFMEIPSSLPRKSGLQNVEHMALLIAGAIVAAIGVASIFTCLMLRWRRKRNQQPTGSGPKQFPWHPFKRRQPSDDILSEKAQAQQPQPLGHFQNDQRPTWDPESTFARPLSKPPKALSPVTQARTKFQSWTSRSILKKGSQSNNQERSIPNTPLTAKINPASTVQEVIPQTPKGNATNSTSSSTLLRPEQPAAPKDPKMVSKFSWSTPRTATSVPSSTERQSTRRSYASKQSQGDGATVYTSDSEPPRFRTVFSWVQQQQTKTMKRTGQSPDGGVVAPGTAT